MSDVRVLKVLAFTTLPAPSPPSKDLAAWYSFSDSKKPLCVFTICHSVVFSGSVGRILVSWVAESFTYNSCIIIRNDSESPTNQLCESPPSNRVPGCPCRNGPRLQGTNDGPWQESEGSQGMKIPSPSITFLFPRKNFAKKMHQKSKSTYYVTTSCYYVDASFRSKIFLHNPHVPWFLVLLSRDEHEPQPATGSPGSHWVPPRAALVAFLRRFTLEKPGLELIMQRSTAGITDISQRSSDVSASGKDSQKVSKGDCWKVGDSQHQNQS